MRRVLRWIYRVFLVVVALAIPLGFIRWPASDPPARADAVVVLSGDYGERLAGAMELIHKGVTNTLVFAGDLDSAEARRLCEQPSPLEVVCLQPRPDDTRAEARAVGALAKQRRWRRIVVVTATFHAARSRLLFRRCFPGDVRMFPRRQPSGGTGSGNDVTHEWLALWYFSVHRGC